MYHSFFVYGQLFVNLILMRLAYDVCSHAHSEAVFINAVVNAGSVLKSV